MQMFNHPLFKILPESKLNVVMEKSFAIELKKGEVLFLQDDKASFVYYVEAGTLKVLKTSPSGQEKIFSIYQAKQNLALGVLFNPPYHYPATAIATEKTIAWAIPIMELENAIVSSEEATRLWFKHLNRRLEKIQELLSDEVFSEAKEKFKKFLKVFNQSSDVKNPEWVNIKVSLTQQEMAELLSIRRETYSRLLTELKDEGNLKIGTKKTLQVKMSWLGNHKM